MPRPDMCPHCGHSVTAHTGQYCGACGEPLFKPSNRPAFVVIHGFHTSAKTPVEYVTNIVYGTPRVEVVLVGSRFIAILEYPYGQSKYAQTTFERMSSFSHGAMLTFEIEVALREFGGWVRHYAPGTFMNKLTEMAK